MTSQPSLFEPSGFSCQLVAPTPMQALPEPTNDQRRVRLHSRGALGVWGGPGTGKSTAVAWWALEQMRQGTPPEHILVITPTRRAALRLRGQIVATWGRTSVAPSVVTCHSWSLALLRAFGQTHDAALPLKLLTAPEQEFRVREVLDGGSPDRWPESLHAAYPTRSFAREVRSIIARARQLAMDPEDVADVGREAGLDSWVAVAQFFDEYLSVLDFENAIDYTELVHRARLLLAQPHIGDAVRARVAAVGVDDIQHLDAAQFGLVRQIVGRTLPVVVSMDPDQSVNSFRGSTTPTRERLARGLSADGVLGEVTLTRAFRGGSSQWRSLANVSSRLPVLAGFDQATSARVREPIPLPRAGRVEMWLTDSESAQAEHVADRLRHAHVVDGLEWSDMAVITRHGRTSLPVLSRGLVAWGVPVRVTGDEVGLASEPTVRPLLLALAVAGGVTQLDPSVATRLLQSPLVGMDSMSVRRLGRALRAAEREELAGTGIGSSSGDLIANALAHPTVAGDHLDVPEWAKARELGLLLQRCTEAIEAGASAHQVLWMLWESSTWPMELRETALRGGPAGRSADRDLDAVVALFELVGRKETTGNRGVRDVLAEVETQQIAADQSRDDDPSSSAVTLLTAHRSAGKQWRLVVVAGAQEGAWPDLRRREGLLWADRLTRETLIEPPPMSAQLAEERRLFYVACSRASEHLIVTAVAGTQGEGDAPSRFTAELGVEPTVVSGRPRSALTLPGLVAELRRCLVDPSASPPLRAAAGARLRRLADLRDYRGRHIASAADPRRWWGIREVTTTVTEPLDEVRLSGSSLEQLLSCPRKWFCERKAKADRPRPGAATLGSVIHVLAQHAATAGDDVEQLVSRLDDVWTQLPFEAAWVSAAERIEAEAALERLAAYTQTHNNRELLGVEVPFSVRVDTSQGPVRLTGAVDRLELTPDGGLLIVDLKTGRRAPSARSTATNAQLGVYQLAAQLGGFDGVAPTRTLAGAELVYLRVNDGEAAAYPKVLRQRSLDEDPAPVEAGLVAGSTWVHDQLAQAAGVVRQGDYPARVGDQCRFCAFASSCPATSQGRQLP